MPGKIYLIPHITRSMLQTNPKTLFVFGDNMMRLGLGGQAKEMRGEPNSVGIPTKWSPNTTLEAYFINADISNPKILSEINKGFDRLEKHLKENGDVIFPKAGIGTGLSQLEHRAPEVLKYIELNIRRLYEITEEET